MKKNSYIGWLWVGVQFLIFYLLLFAPLYHSLPLSRGMIIVGQVFIFTGIIIGIKAIMDLGSSLTATPIPKRKSILRTKGIYAYIRHPIYTSGLITFLGVVFNRPAISSILLYAILIVFFYLKSIFEEKLLSEQFKQYIAYQKITGRFLPKL